MRIAGAHQYHASYRFIVVFMPQCPNSMHAGVQQAEGLKAAHRITPPEEPSRDMASASAVATKSSASCRDMPSLQQGKHGHCSMDHFARQLVANADRSCRHQNRFRALPRHVFPAHPILEQPRGPAAKPCSSMRVRRQ